VSPAQEETDTDNDVFLEMASPASVTKLERRSMEREAGPPTGPYLGRGLFASDVAQEGGDGAENYESFTAP